MAPCLEGFRALGGSVWDETMSEEAEKKGLRKDLWTKDIWPVDVIALQYGMNH